MRMRMISAVKITVTPAIHGLRCATNAASRMCSHVRHASTSAPSSSSSASSSTPLTPIARIQKDLAYCREQIKTHDNDQYLCSMLLPASARAGSHIVRAFNLELAHVVSRHSVPTAGVTEQQEMFGELAKVKQAPVLLTDRYEPTQQEENQLRVGMMKLQWWRDGLENAMEKVEKLRLHPAASISPDDDSSTSAHAQPVLNMLAIACKQYRLTNRWLSRMIDAREKSLTEGQPEDINDLLNYSESTSSALLYLTLECMNIRNMHADHAASHIGKAMGIALTLRSLPYNASKRQIFLPRTIVKAQNLDLLTVLSGSNSPELADCVFELASVAKSHIEHARELLPTVPKEARSALVSAALCDIFLTRLEKHNFNLFDPSLGLLPTAPKSASDPAKESSISGVSLSGSNQGLQPLRLRFELLKHQLKGTY